MSIRLTYYQTFYTDLVVIAVCNYISKTTQNITEMCDQLSFKQTKLQIQKNIVVVFCCFKQIYLVCTLSLSSILNSRALMRVHTLNNG